MGKLFIKESGKIYCPYCGSKVADADPRDTAFEDRFKCDKCGFTNRYLAFSEEPLKQANEKLLINFSENGDTIGMAMEKIIELANNDCRIDAIKEMIIALARAIKRG